MKKSILAVTVIATLCFSFTLENTVMNDTVTELNSTGDKITLINDTSEKVSVHTGYGSVSLSPRGGKTSFSCNPGKTVKANGSAIFKVSSDHCGSTIKLSDYID